MTAELISVAKRFCRELGSATGYRPLQWQSILLIGVRCRVRAPKELDRIVAYAEKAGWLVVGEGRKVALTEDGRRLGQAARASNARKSGVG